MGAARLGARDSLVLRDMQSAECSIAQEEASEHPTPMSAQTFFDQHCDNLDENIRTAVGRMVFACRW
jgi:hypothetical protein